MPNHTGHARWPVVFFVVWLLFLSGGCTFGRDKKNTVRYTPPPSAVGLVSSATIGPDDVFEVKVYGDKDLSGIYRVGPEGTILFPLVGKIKVVGLTSSEVAELIAKKLSKYVRQPYVSVYMKEFNSKKVFVFGEVKKPGTFRYEDNMTIIQAITMAGGFTARAAANKTSVTRLLNGKEYQVVVPVEDIAEGKRRNFFLQPGDIVFVPEALF